MSWESLALPRRRATVACLPSSIVPSVGRSVAGATGALGAPTAAAFTSPSLPLPRRGSKPLGGVLQGSRSVAFASWPEPGTKLAPGRRAVAFCRSKGRGSVTGSGSPLLSP